MELRDRILLLMKYDNSATLKENTEKLLTEQVTPITKILRTLSGMADETLEKVIGKDKTEINNLIRKGRKSVAEIDDIFKSIKDTKTLATKLLDDYAIFNETQLKGLTDMLVSQVVNNPKNYSKIIGDLSNEIMSQKNLPSSAKKLIDDYSSLISARVKNELSKKHPEIFKTLFKTKGLSKKLSKAESKNLDPKTIKWWERVLSTDKTVVDLFKGWVDDAANKLILRNKGDQKYINDLFSKLQQATEDSIYKLKRGEKIDNTLLRNINTNIRVLSQKYKADTDAIYDELSKLLNKRYPSNSYEISEIMEQVKKNNPFQSGRWGALSQFLDSTSTNKLMGNFRKGLFGKEKTKEWSEFAERIVSLMVSGAPKSINEWSSYFRKGTPGLISLYRDLWVALHVGMPLTLSFIGAIFNLTSIPIFGNNTEAQSFMEDWWSRVMNRYQNMINGWSKLGLIIPIHPYGYDVYKFTSDVYAEKYTYFLEKSLISELEKLSDTELSKFQGYDPNKSRVENIRTIVEIAKKNALRDIEQPATTETIQNNSTDNLTLFKNYIKQNWGSDYSEGNVTFTTEGDYYVATDKSVNMKYLYKKVNNTFEYVGQ